MELAMSGFVMAIGKNPDIGPARAEPSMASGAIDQQMHEAERVLERLRRDLSAAQAHARQQEQKLAEARRLMEQWRWVNAIHEGEPETLRLAAVSLMAQTHVVDAAVKSNADVSARVERLQNRIDRQIARYFDLQSRRRVSGGERRYDSPIPNRTEAPADRRSTQAVFAEPADDAATPAVYPRQRRYGLDYSGYVAGRDKV
jgi:hypothetical protein